MEYYIISQVAFLTIICFIRVIQDFGTSNKLFRKHLMTAIFAVVLVMIFIQGYLKGYYLLSDSFVSIVNIAAAILFAFFNLIIEKLKIHKTENKIEDGSPS